MAKIVIRNLNYKSISTEDSSQTILHIIHSNQIDWMFACGAKGKCTTCKMIVHKGMESFNPPTAAEQKFKDLGKLKANERLACQNNLLGDLEISVAQPNKFPHITYND